jgi:hypothetical protein
VIPESIHGSPEKFSEIQKSHGLESQFNIYGFENLAPSCRRCNSAKAASVLPPGRTAIILAMLNRKLERVKRLRQTYGRLAGADEAIVGVLTALQTGAASIADVMAAVESYNSRGRSGRFSLYRKLEFLDGTKVADLHKSDAERLLDIPVKLGTELPEGVKMVNSTGQVRFVRTTREYRDAVGQEFFPANNFYQKMADFFELPLAVISAIGKAKAPRTSFISEPRIGIGDLRYLPLWLLPYLAQPPKEPGCATLADVQNSGRLVLKSSTPFSIEFEYDDMERYIVEVMRSALNNDGIEDILAFSYERTVEGTFAVAYTIALTRKSREGLLEPVFGISRRFDSSFRFWQEHSERGSSS